MNDIYADFIIIIRIYYYCTYVSIYIYIYIVYINNYLYDNSILYHIGYIMSIIIILLCGGGVVFPWEDSALARVVVVGV